MQKRPATEHASSAPLSRRKEVQANPQLLENRQNARKRRIRPSHDLIPKHPIRYKTHFVRPRRAWESLSLALPEDAAISDTPFSFRRNEINKCTENKDQFEFQFCSR